MFKKIKNSVIIVASMMALSVPVMATASVSAAAVGCNNNVESNIGSGISSTGSSTTGHCSGGTVQSGISSIAKTVINIFSLVVGIVSVFMIIYAGFRYITSGGDSGNTSGARNTLLYAIVGLIIVAIAQVIVRFVLKTSTKIQ